MLSLLDANNRWYALRTKSRHEKIVASSVKAKGYPVLLPLYHEIRRWSGRDCEVELPLFSGYVFAQFDQQRCLPILQTPGVVQIVGTRDRPSPVDELDIEHIHRIIEGKVAARPSPCYTAGQIVEIIRGPLTGVRGIFIRDKNGYRLVVSVALLQRAVGVEVDVSSVRPVSSRLQQAEKVLAS
jgi:transcriptional antiterminator NusG